MNKAQIIILAVLVIFSACAENTDKSEKSNHMKDSIQNETPPGKYPYASAKITFQQKDSKNYAVHYFAEHGAKERIETVNYIAGKATSSVIIIKDEIIYKYTPELNAGSKRSYTPYNMIRMDFSRRDAINNPGVSIEHTGKETVLGKACQIYKVQAEGEMTVYYSVYKNIILKEKSTFVELTATEIDENFVPDDSLFELPQGVELMEF